jgi:diguanylate cyclase (GGDEF)-like protein/PAS domain S-box-containing protein
MDSSNKDLPDIRKEQLRVLADTVPATGIAAVSNALVIVFVFWCCAPSAWLLGWLALNLVWVAALCADRGGARDASPWAFRRIFLRAGSLGILWGALPWILLPNAESGHLVLVGVAAAGMLAGGAVRLAVVPQAAVLFVWTMAILTSAALFYDGVPSPMLASLGLATLALFMTIHISRYRNAHVQNQIDKLEIAAQRDTIRLLLKDFHDQSSDWLWELDSDGRVRNPSHRFVDSVGLARTELEGRRLLDLVAFAEPLENLIQRRQAFRDIEVKVNLAGADLPRYWSLSGRPILDTDGVFAGYQGVAADATEMVTARERLQVIARVDSLSGLPNRLAFTEHLESDQVRDLAATKRLGVVYADVNGFKIVNDTVGHAGGDRLVQALAQRLQNELRDNCFLARVGGDEFNVCVFGEDAEQATRAVAERMVKCFQHEFSVDGSLFHVTAAVGYAVSDGTAEPPELVRRADVAMYRSKAIRTREPIRYDERYESGADKRKEIESELRAALKAGDLKVLYQPIVRSADGSLASVEALLRWGSAKLGTVSPAAFIPVAEETGLIVDIGRYVLEEACSVLNDWPDLLVSINVSPVELREPSFVDDVKDIVTKAGVDPARIEFELTESILVSHLELAAERLSQLKAVGFKIALDDFGTGFSSIGYLRQLPFDKLKIDRSFVSKVDAKDSSRGLLQTLISLGHALDLTVVAEGVENEEQAFITQSAGSHLQQGFLYSKAEPIADVKRRFGEPAVGTRALS